MDDRGPARPGRDAHADELGVLLTRVARGDLAAYEAVYDRTAGQILGIVLAVVRDPAQSEEVAQEVLLDVWRSPRGSTRISAAPPPGWRPWPTAGRSTGSGQSRKRQNAKCALASSTVAYDEVTEAVEAISTGSGSGGACRP